MWALVTASQSWQSTAISHLGAVSAVASGQPWPLNLCASPHHPRLQAVASEDMRVNACWLRAALEEFPATVPTAYQLADAFVGAQVAGSVADTHGHVRSSVMDPLPCACPAVGVQAFLVQGRTRCGFGLLAGTVPLAVEEVTPGVRGARWWQRT